MAILRSSQNKMIFENTGHCQMLDYFFRERDNFAVFLNISPSWLTSKARRVSTKKVLSKPSAPSMNIVRKRNGYTKIFADAPLLVNLDQLCRRSSLHREDKMNCVLRVPIGTYCIEMLQRVHWPCKLPAWRGSEIFSQDRLNPDGSC